MQLRNTICWQPKEVWNKSLLLWYPLAGKRAIRWKYYHGHRLQSAAGLAIAGKALHREDREHRLDECDIPPSLA